METTETIFTTTEWLTLSETIYKLNEIINDISLQWNTIYHQRTMIMLITHLYTIRASLKKWLIAKENSLLINRDNTEELLVLWWMAKTPAEREARKTTRDESSKLEQENIEIESLKEKIWMYKYYIRLWEIELQKDSVLTSVAL